jgi:hypothetical protein
MSSAGLEGIAYLKNPRQIPGSKFGFMFDAYMFLKYDEKGDEESLIACLRYFNDKDRFEFGEIGLYSLTAWVSFFSFAVELGLIYAIDWSDRQQYNLGENALPRDEYTFVGDIQRVI